MYTAHPLDSIWWVTSAILQHIVGISITFFFWNVKQTQNWCSQTFHSPERYRCFHINISYFVCLIKQFPYSCLKHWPHKVFGILCSMWVLSWYLFGKRINCQRKSLLMLRKREREKKINWQTIWAFSIIYFSIYIWKLRWNIFVFHAVR